jgi:hypothetical protein
MENFYMDNEKVPLIMPVNIVCPHCKKAHCLDLPIDDLKSLAESLTPEELSLLKTTEPEEPKGEYKCNYCAKQYDIPVSKVVPIWYAIGVCCQECWDKANFDYNLEKELQ